MIFVGNLDALVARTAVRGLDPARRETYPDGAREPTYCESEGNEFCFAGAPAVGD